jgi:hypothetical protein
MVCAYVATEKSRLAQPTRQRANSISQIGLILDFSQEQ